MVKVELFDDIFLTFISKPIFLLKQQNTTYLAFVKSVHNAKMCMMWNKEVNCKFAHGYSQSVGQIGKVFKATNFAFMIISP